MGAGSDARPGREDAIVRIFAVDPADHRHEYERQGWIHIKNGMTPEFLAALNDFVARAMNGGRGDERFAFQGKKEQIVYDFGDNSKHGITRDIPTRFHYNNRYDRLEPVSDIRVTGSPGTPVETKITDCLGADAGRSFAMSVPNRTVPAASAPQDTTLNMQDR